MKKLLIPALLASALVLSTSVMADQGQIQFTGEIVKASCLLDANNKNQTVPLGKYSVDTFTRAGTTTVPQQFTITAKDCGANTAQITFNGTKVGKDLIQVDEGGAKGVGIYIRKASGEANIEPNTSLEMPSKEKDESDFVFYAGYQQIDGTTPTPGPANATVNFDVNMK